MINESGKDIRELNLDELEQVSGAGQLEDLINKIKASGKYNYLKNKLQKEGKVAAAADCCEYFGPLCGFCASAVTML